MATLYICNSFEITSQGVRYFGKQGSAADGFFQPFSVTVDGKIHLVTSTLATAAVATVYDDDDDLPADWDYLFFWADQDVYLQLIAASQHVVHKVEAKVPFLLPGFDGIVAAANATAITGGSEPSLSDIDSVVIGNYSGSTANYLFAVID